MNLTTRFAILALVAVTLAPRMGLAQIATDTTHWNDEFLYQDEEKGAPSFFSVGGGVLGAFFKPDLSAFNKNLGLPFTHTTYREQVWMIGGQGFVTIPWVKNLRVGGLGYSGASTDCGCIDTTLSGSSVNRFMDYEVGYAALTIDYVLPLRTGRFHIVPGIALGYGAVNIFMRQAATRIEGSTNSITGEFDGSSLYTTHTYTAPFFLYMPQAQFEYSPLGYLMLRASVGYQGTSMGTWTVDRGVGLSSSDALTDINGSGIIASLGVFLGLFQ